VISVITSNWGTIGAGLGTFYKTHQDVSACQLDIVLSYGVAISLDLTNADATVEFSLWFTTDITNAGATWSNPITITVTMPSSAGAGTVTTGTYTGSHSFGSPFTGPVYVFLAARRTDVASGTTVNPLCFTGTLSMV
ncbi:MAG TPA: hypothetical protein VHD33_00005, partial [Legionellaceae bacterium]|nr:hypothetical protein [Legionellaceae bacterium]